MGSFLAGSEDTTPVFKAQLALIRGVNWDAMQGKLIADVRAPGTQRAGRPLFLAPRPTRR